MGNSISEAFSASRQTLAPVAQLITGISNAVKV
jgi:hypothetical protein